MAKKKNEELNFLYTNEDNKKTKKKTKSKKKDSGAEIDSAHNQKFNFDNEIVIGVTIPETKKKKGAKEKNKKSNNKKSKKNPKKETYNKRQAKNKDKIDKKPIEKKQKNDFLKTFIKWCILIVALIAAIIFFLMSPLFNISEIQVLNNNKISSETIISLSKIEIGQNIYKTTKTKIKKNIKENAYIENVKIKRKLPNKIEIDVKERKATYMLEYAGSYAYINNQGYILEISEEKLQVPIIVGYKTKEEDIRSRTKAL